MRISSLQTDVLISLALLESLGKTDKVFAKHILKIINSTREANEQTLIFGASLRLSLKTLTKNGLVRQFKNITNGELSYLLTDEGRALAIERQVRQDLKNVA
ncbi:hypothetical protein OCF84_21550 (plasmid) [Shewanella xiamenensis]|uniref:Uncharacterized protein n=1 Tax=Shewanella xiamenensis TaxID=332186 RepID=A0ABT6UDL7_9GAMM|nr:hypothetical protein [Shewanella xiamenensis]MDI5832537.1 hypothetical protein [Shewanella xiamenensis]WHF57845.1 hypothetical protein OCF84_21550 [Shewanella xiamenensis]